MSKLTWYLARLRSMRPAEILWRARRVAGTPLDYLDKLRGESRQRYQPSGAWWERIEYPVTYHHDGGDFTVTRIFDLEFPAEFRFDWHHDYRNDKDIARVFSRFLDIRDPDTVGDIKYVWEINRQQHLSAIAFSNRPDSAQIVSAALRSWIDDNPYLVGVNWTSSLELALRLISWAFMYPALRSQFVRDREFREAFAASIYLHLRTIRNHLSLYSSANNHLIGELAGLYVGTVCFPWWPDCEAWRSLALHGLEREIQLQFTHEGVNREQATSYQLFTLELLLVAMLVGRNSGRVFSGAFGSRVRAALDYLASLATPRGDLPWLGDSDDARGFLTSANESALQVVMQLGGMFFDEPRFIRFAPETTAAARALMPEKSLQIPKSTEVIGPDRSVQLLREGGTAIIQSGSWKLVMDVGPLGYTSIAAHGHADALSLALAAGDSYILVDSGTYAYHSHPEWRSYFRGTAAHNTARVDGLDQSTAAGRFLWSSRANVRILAFQESDGTVYIEAEHDGYLRLSDPVLHRRAVAFDREQGTIVVEDSFIGKQEHDIEIHWHLSERADVRQLSDGTLLCSMDDHGVAFAFSGQPCDVSVIRGATLPILGWRSLSFNSKIPISTVRCACRTSGAAKVATRIDLS